MMHRLPNGVHMRWLAKECPFFFGEESSFLLSSLVSLSFVQWFMMNGAERMHEHLLFVHIIIQAVKHSASFLAKAWILSQFSFFSHSMDVSESLFTQRGNFTLEIIFPDVYDDDQKDESEQMFLSLLSSLSFEHKSAGYLGATRMKYLRNSWWVDEALNDRNDKLLAEDPKEGGGIKVDGEHEEDSYPVVYWNRCPLILLLRFESELFTPFIQWNRNSHLWFSWLFSLFPPPVCSRVCMTQHSWSQDRNANALMYPSLWKRCLIIRSSYEPYPFDRRRCWVVAGDYCEKEPISSQLLTLGMEQMFWQSVKCLSMETVLIPSILLSYLFFCSSSLSQSVCRFFWGSQVLHPGKYLFQELKFLTAP